MDFETLAGFAKEQEYLRQAKPRERVWYEYEKELIASKFCNEIKPVPIYIYRRKRARTIGVCYGDKITLHNKVGCTRSTLLHELTHLYLKGKYRKSHVTEFWELYKYLLHGGNVQEFYAREVKQTERIAAMRLEKRSPAYRLTQVKERLRAWETKLKRATTAIKKLKRQEKVLAKRVV